MKLKRRLLMLTLVATMLFSMATVAYAASKTYVEETVNSVKTSLHIKGKVDYYDAWWCLASVEYMATLDGTTSDIASYCPQDGNDSSYDYSQVYVRIQDENKTIKTRRFTVKTLSVSGSHSIPCANFSTLVVRSYDNTKLLIDRNDD